MTGAKSHRALPPREWPAIDREAWKKATAPGDEISGWGKAAAWAPRTRENAELAYGRFVGFLGRSHRLRTVSRVGERLVENDLCAFGYELSAVLAPYTVLGIFTSLNLAVKALDPDADRAVLNQIVSRLSQTATSVRDVGGNLVPPPVLVELGEAMMNEAEAMTPKLVPTGQSLP